MHPDRQQPSHKRPAPLDRFWFGATYYPEHWSEEDRADDAARMEQAGFNAVRMAEFAWDYMEPEEGVFRFDLFDKTIARLAERGIETLLCTPTATPPRWLTHQHPQVLHVNVDGQTMEHGSRQHCCYSSDVFREYSRKITRAMAEHYRNNDHVVGWQTDNEFNCHFAECHCASCQREFRAFLRQKFSDDIGALNRTWGTAFWGQTYGSFDEINTPRERPFNVNPAKKLDYFRYISYSVTRFQHDQVEILREANPDWFVFHNGTFRDIDYRGAFADDLDCMGYDSYPMFSHNPRTRPAGHAFNLDRARAWCGNFIIPEHQSGPGGHVQFALDAPRPGEVRRQTYASIAHGADSLLYFRWRTCRFGAEQYWRGILDHDNIPRRMYDEVRQVGEELQRVAPEVLGTSVAIDVAVATSDQMVADSHLSYHLGLPAPDNMAETFHKVLYDEGLSVGCVHPSDDLEGLRLYILPHWAWFDPAWLPNLSAFVEKGGVLVVGARTATRDVHNNIPADPLPAALRELSGATVIEYGRQNAPDMLPKSILLPKETVRSEWWYELLEPEHGTDVLARWDGGHATGEPAITLKSHGKGRVLYVGTYFTSAVAKALMPTLYALGGLSRPLPGIPAGVEVVRRQGEGKTLWFLINHSDDPARLRKLPAGRDLVSGADVEKNHVLEGGGVMVLRLAGLS